MNEQKSLLLEIAEAIDSRLRQRAPQDENAPPPKGGPRWPHWLGQQMIPNIGTLLIVIILLLTIPSLAAPLLQQTSTSTISYQGRLADDEGTPLTGMYNMEFRLYDVPTGGVPLWEEFWTGANSVAVSDGLFNVMLGSIDSTLVSSIEGYEELYLGITVGTDSEMVPRVQLGSVPFAMTAQNLMGQVTTEQIADGAVTQHQAVSGSTVANTTSTSFVDLPGQSITLTSSGGAVLVLFSGSHTASNEALTGYWQIIRDDSVVIAHNNHSFSPLEWTTTAMFGIDTPPAGEHTYKVQWRVNIGTLTASEGVYSENFTAIEFKR